jgi:hypothetical protein
MASFTSILSDIGNGLKKFFGKALPIAEAAEPIINVAFPGVSTLYDTVVTEVANAETAAIAAGAQNGTGAQKLAAVLASPGVQSAFAAIEAAGGISAPTTAQQTAYINAVVASLNALPTATTAPAA